MISIFKYTKFVFWKQMIISLYRINWNFHVGIKRVQWCCHVLQKRRISQMVLLQTKNHLKQSWLFS